MSSGSGVTARAGNFKMVPVASLPGCFAKYWCNKSMVSFSKGNRGRATKPATCHENPKTSCVLTRVAARCHGTSGCPRTVLSDCKLLRKAKLSPPRVFCATLKTLWMPGVRNVVGNFGLAVGIHRPLCNRNDTRSSFQVTWRVAASSGGQWSS